MNKNSFYSGFADHGTRKVALGHSFCCVSSLSKIILQETFAKKMSSLSKQTAPKALLRMRDLLRWVFERIRCDYICFDYEESGLMEWVRGARMKGCGSPVDEGRGIFINVNTILDKDINIL